jgi:hypothetical protein
LNNILDIDERELNIIQVIQLEDLTFFTFEGLKRRLKIHPEKLSRILSRLIQDKIIKKNENDYSLTEKGKQILNKSTQTSNTPEIPILQSILPPDLKIEKIISNLKGKWFGNLRWLGYSKSNENIELKWITTEGEIIVSVVFTQNMFYISGKSNAEIDFSSTLNVAYNLMSHVTKLISKTENN